jgi:hypothetical protein
MTIYLLHVLSLLVTSFDGCKHVESPNDRRARFLLVCERASANIRRCGFTSVGLDEAKQYLAPERKSMFDGRTPHPRVGFTGVALPAFPQFKNVKRGDHARCKEQTQGVARCYPVPLTTRRQQ